MKGPQNMRRMRIRARMAVPMRGRVKARPRRNQAFQSSPAKGSAAAETGARSCAEPSSGAEACSLRRQVERRRVLLV